MTGICPFAKQLIIPALDNDPPIKPRVAILHVDAANSSSLYTYFRDRSGGIESHFFVKATGEIEQYRDIYRQADANLDANDFAVSIETQGYGVGTWNDAQLASIKRLLTWLNREAGIPLQEIQTWDGSGVGYHTQFGAPSHWTPVAKSCPGPDRIKQYRDVIVPWLETRGERPLPTQNYVARGRELITQGLALLDKAPVARKAVHREAKVIRERLKVMPKN